MGFSNRLKDLRTNNGMKQKELADILGVTVSTISAYEQGTRTPDINMATSIANYFDITLDNLMSRKTKSAPDLKQLIKDNAMTYGGKDISNDDLILLEGVVGAVLDRKNRPDE